MRKRAYTLPVAVKNAIRMIRTHLASLLHTSRSTQYSRSIIGTIPHCQIMKTASIYFFPKFIFICRVCVHYVESTRLQQHGPSNSWWQSYQSQERCVIGVLMSMRWSNLISENAHKAGKINLWKELYRRSHHIVRYSTFWWFLPNFT